MRDEGVEGEGGAERDEGRKWQQRGRMKNRAGKWGRGLEMMSVDVPR